MSEQSTSELFRYVICNKCGWVHMGVTFAFANAEVKQFNEYYFTLSEEDKEKFYGNICSRIERYVECFKCGNRYTNFRDASLTEIPAGSTIQSILYFEEELR